MSDNMRDTREKVLDDICSRLQTIENDMNTVLAMVNRYAFPRNGECRQPVGGIGLLKSTVSAKSKLSALLLQCKRFKKKI